MIYTQTPTTMKKQRVKSVYANSTHSFANRVSQRNYYVVHISFEKDTNSYDDDWYSIEDLVLCSGFLQIKVPNKK